MMSPGQHTDKRPQPRLYLVTPVAAHLQMLAADLAAALGAADVAAVLMRLPDEDERALINRVKTIAPVVQTAGAALLIDRHQLVARGGADGAHLIDIADFVDAVGGLKPDRIAGVGGLETRHDAMLAAERGADYVMFGEPDNGGARPALDAILDRVSWWAEVFQIPCVGYAAGLDEISPLVEAGADFVTVGDFIFSDPRGAAQAIADADSRLALPEVIA